METFTIAPAGSRVLAFWFIPVLLALVIVPVAILIGRSLVASRSASFTVSSAGLELQGDWYGRRIPLDQINVDEVRRVDLSVDTGLAPRWRTFGTGLPGYQSGWFNLQNGEKALLYLTDRSRAVYIPTRAGYGVLLSPEEPDAFVAALRTAGNAGQ